MENLTSREIFERLDLAGKDTLELQKSTNLFRAELRKYIPDESDVENVFGYASVMSAESHYIGFMQGISLAFNLLRELD